MKLLKNASFALQWLRASEVFKLIAGFIFKSEITKMMLAKNIKNWFLSKNFCVYTFYQIHYLCNSSFWKFPTFPLSTLIIFYSPWNDQKGYCFLINSTEIEVNWFAKFYLILEVKFADNDLVGKNMHKSRAVTMFILVVLWLILNTFCIKFKILVTCV